MLGVGQPNCNHEESVSFWGCLSRNTGMADSLAGSVDICQPQHTLTAGFMISEMINICVA